MYCIVEQGGYQFKVSEGDTIDIPHIDGDEGNEVGLEKVIGIQKDNEGFSAGTPVVEGVTVKGTIVKHGKGDKVMTIKKKRRKDYLRKKGHRQDYTSVKITSITA
ncbi:MAG: 50S ribosomal protein L21 [Chitinivibrionales bacterium]|nr:50S ribosomal protein L21 [Chitinivibrionales bacterium]